MHRIQITLEYLGTAFHGWQRQRNALSVQEVLEQALAKISGAPVTVYAGGRTDTGVHARGQVCHVDLPVGVFVRLRRQQEPLARVLGRLCQSVNALVRPHPVAIHTAVPVSDSFHARFSAAQRSYVYRILNRLNPSPLRAEFCWHVSAPLDIAAMTEAATKLLGTHDFSSFRGPYCQAQSPIRTVHALDVARREDEVIVSVQARSFLHRQVRNFVGSLVAVGQGKHPPQWVASVLMQKCRAAAGETAPPFGLCLDTIAYPAETLQENQAFAQLEAALALATETHSLRQNGQDKIVHCSKNA